ncbi:Prefoldin subunit family protein [Theileria parva strain Muguga]|uniref:Prefoldin subunit family protein n=1 Tax=Theileria parva strain Muguga TaxID=333668 RepID=UPI001C6229EF|nr:Prefoldin subunit family protein [Theileria parva strain Muguga]EAN31461.2 Prefoldin subunit family protein [Theileria parva strain Muguga]
MDYEVSEEDHRKIIEFSLLHHKKLGLEQRLKLLKHERNLLTDAQDEATISLETPLYHLGECFMRVGEEELELELRERSERLDSEIEKLTLSLEENVKESSQLKSQLYNKFGNRINLDS